VFQSDWPQSTLTGEIIDVRHCPVKACKSIPRYPHTLADPDPQPIPALTDVSVCAVAHNQLTPGLFGALAIMKQATHNAEWEKRDVDSWELLRYLVGSTSSSPPNTTYPRWGHVRQLCGRSPFSVFRMLKARVALAWPQDHLCCQHAMPVSFSFCHECCTSRDGVSPDIILRKPSRSTEAPVGPFGPNPGSL
jgi:hypothetical protein